jgi:prefoldin subunit 5
MGVEMEKEKPLKISVRDVVEFLFLPVLTAGVFVLWDLNKSVGTLNVQVGTLIAYNTTNEKGIEKLERRIEKLEEIKQGNVAQK